MKYFIDTEFHEYKKKSIPFSKGVDTIELISIAIVSETWLSPYYAVSKDFDLKAAWKNEWLRENVLRSLHKDLSESVSSYGKTYYSSLFVDFSLKSLKNLIKWYGKSNKHIAAEIIMLTEDHIPEFYGYYSDYDWVVFCWLFGRMVDLPRNFPMYCKDLKQTLDEFCDSRKMSLTEVKTMKGFPVQNESHHAKHDALWNKNLYKFIEANA